mmetsp:Transcript_31743/g.58273  ORF Transcript_31743/g.58273 Transcript_31743/m.58273 type:complete len:108 (-) Transcript_31743:241-564(-)
MVALGSVAEDGLRGITPPAAGGDWMQGALDGMAGVLTLVAMVACSATKDEPEATGGDWMQDVVDGMAGTPTCGLVAGTVWNAFGAAPALACGGGLDGELDGKQGMHA